MSGSVSALTVAGSRTSGTPIRTQNVMAANAIANIVKSSLGPVGLDKMLVDDIGVSKIRFNYLITKNYVFLYFNINILVFWDFRMLL